ncbi:MAG TPA: hypothetical protein ENK08_02975 [Chloroflexi bacterium]|nr:hypothetical protein [Chloroflexota bacterium]
MEYAIHKLTFAEGRAYRYQVVDKEGKVRYIAEPTGLLLPTPTHQVTFFDADHQPLARLEPLATSPWRWTRTFILLLEEETESATAIEERWTLVDRLLLRLPTYTLRVGSYTYAARGRRYGEALYELFEPPPATEPSQEAEEEPSEGLQAPPEVEEIPPKKVGEVLHPPVGPSYMVLVEAAPLRQAPLVLTAFVVLIDLHLYG